MKPKALVSRKILVASVGVATISYACGGQSRMDIGNSSLGGASAGGASAGGATSGNLLPPPDAGVDAGGAGGASGGGPGGSLAR